MKKLILSAYIFVVFIGTFTVKPNVAIAQNDCEYLRVINQVTALYKDEALTEPLCFLPTTYYLKVISIIDEVARVECFGCSTAPTIDGYVKLSEVKQATEEVEEPFLEFCITTSVCTPFYVSSNQEQVYQLIFADRKLGYYGMTVNDKNQVLYLVYYNGKAGYVQETYVTPFTLPIHPVPLETPTKKPQTVVEEVRSDTNELLKTAIILSLLIAGIISLVVAVSKKKSNPNGIQTCEEEDFE